MSFLFRPIGRFISCGFRPFAVDGQPFVSKTSFSFLRRKQHEIGDIIDYARPSGSLDGTTLTAAALMTFSGLFCRVPFQSLQLRGVVTALRPVTHLLHCHCLFLIQFKVETPSDRLVCASGNSIIRGVPPMKDSTYAIVEFTHKLA